MMTLRLNLLSQEKKNNFIKMMRFLFIKEMLEFTTLTAALLAIMFLGAWWVMAQVAGEVAASALLVNRDPPPVNKEIEALNAVTKDINASGQNFLLVSPRLAELATLLPQDVRLVGLSLDRTNNTIDISGTAATREALVNFQKMLDDIDWISGATKPSPQLLQKENINFEIHGSLRLR